jgi:hypothetical protein
MPHVATGTLRQGVATLGSRQTTRGTDGQSVATLGHLTRLTGGHRTMLVVGHFATIDRTGFSEGTQFTAAFASSLPAPHAVFGTGPVCASLRAVDSRHRLMSACVWLPFFWNMRAIVPVTCGAAIDVPPSRR